jgi:hypothetical protein
VRPCSVLSPALGAILAAFTFSQARAQSPSVAFGLNHVVSSGEGISRSCLEPGYSTGLDARYVQPALTKLTSIELTARAYVFAASSTCVDGFPPPDGTYVQADRLSLLAGSFVATDLRFRLRLSHSPRASALAFGIGNTWRSSDNLPYVVAEAQVPFVARRRIRVSAEGELLVVQVAAHRYRRTYQNLQLVASESLGPSYDWRGAFSLGLVMEVPLGRANP